MGHYASEMYHETDEDRKETERLEKKKRKAIQGLAKKIAPPHGVGFADANCVAELLYELAKDPTMFKIRYIHV